MADPDDTLKAALENWVPVRVTDMRGIDLNEFRFNYDLTLAVLLMHPDGTVYSTYAGRDWTDASSHQSTTSLARVLDAALERHRAHEPRERARREPVFVENLAWWRGNKKAQESRCFHCHQVHDAWQNQAREDGTWSERRQFTWPDPILAGMRLDREDQVKLTEARAPLKPADRLVTVGGRRVLAFGDVQQALEDAPWEANALPITLLRDGKRIEVALDLADGWKRPTPEIYAWRGMKWPMSPKPGFGGPLLGPDEKAKLGLPRDSWAFQVRYIVTWGPFAETGRNAQKAGIRKGMVVHEVDGKSDFSSMAHFQAWFRMTRRPGAAVEVKVIQNGTPRTLELVPLP